MNLDTTRGVLLSIFGLIIVVVAISVALAGRKAKTAEAASSFLVVLIAVAILGLGGIGVALGTFGLRILAWLGLDVNAPAPDAAAALMSKSVAGMFGITF